MGRDYPVQAIAAADIARFAMTAWPCQALTVAGIERRVTVHGLRRTFAVLLQESGAPDSVIRQALGHGERGVTELNYLPRRDDAIKRWVDAIDVRVPSLESTPGARSARRVPYLRLVQ